MYKNKDAGMKQKSMLFICLCMIFIAFVGLNLEDIALNLKDNIYEKTLNKEIPIAVKSKERRDEELSFMSRLIYSALKDEMNLFNYKIFAFGGYEMDHNNNSADIDRKHYPNLSKFEVDYGKYTSSSSDMGLKEEHQKGNEVAEVFNSSIVYNYPSAKPQIVIYHTHPGESHDKHGPEDRDNSRNIIAIGEALSQELESYGINVIHDISLHDSIYEKSYESSGKTMDKYLDKYGDVDLFLDMHIDSHNNRALVTTNLNGKSAAKFMFVFSDNAREYQNDFYVAESMLEIARGLYPGILIHREWASGEFHYNRGIGSFNQLKSKNTVLVEIGADCNTFDEGIETTHYLARVIAEYMFKKYNSV